MRQGELLALRWQDIDFESASLYIHRSVVPVTGRGYVENEPKTSGSRRRIRLSQFVLELLKKHRLYLVEVCLKAGRAWRENGLVFPNLRGGFLDNGNLRRIFYKLLEKADLPHMREIGLFQQ